MAWTEILFDTFLHAVMISAFVSMMMIIVEFVNVCLRGHFASRVGRRPLPQSALGGALGVLPGCLGSFTNVTMYEHGMLSFGALISCMIATTGDEAFVMFALYPRAFLILTAILLATGVATGVIADLVKKRRFRCEGDECQDMTYHEECGGGFSGILRQLKEDFSRRNAGRLAVLLGLVVFFILVSQGMIDLHGAGTAHVEGEWIAIALIAVTALAIATTLISSDHFVSDHVVGHVVKRHLAKIFLWIFGTLLVLKIAGNFVDIGGLVKSNRWSMLLLACLVGFVPQSGPHLFFVTLFANGALPFSILLGNSLVQDGHGTLPLLAFGRKEFLLVKSIKFVIGIGIAAAAMAAGF